MVSGQFLNSYFKTEEFKEDEEYQVCANMADRLKKLVEEQKEKEGNNNRTRNNTNRSKDAEAAE